MGLRSRKAESNRIMPVQVLNRDVLVQRSRMDGRVLELYLYVDGMQRIINLGGDGVIFFMIFVMQYLRRSDGTVGLTVEMRANMCKILRIGEATFYRRLALCERVEVIKRLGLGMYMVDPRVATIVKPIKRVPRETI